MFQLCMAQVLSCMAMRMRDEDKFVKEGYMYPKRLPTPPYPRYIHAMLNTCAHTPTHINHTINWALYYFNISICFHWACPSIPWSIFHIVNLTKIACNFPVSRLSLQIHTSITFYGGGGGHFAYFFLIRSNLLQIEIVLKSVHNKKAWTST